MIVSFFGAGMITLTQIQADMTSQKIPPLLLDKIRSCSLFTLYSQAFQIATGYELKLEVALGDGETGVAVKVGRNEFFYLVPVGGCFENDQAWKGILRAFALQLGDEVNRAVLESSEAEPKCVQRAKKYIAEHLVERFQLDDVAEAAGVCSFQLCRIFKKHAGMTMSEYVSRYRVERARRMLADPELQIAIIAEQVGFSSLSQFNRNFLKYAGESPTQYRTGLKEFEHCQLRVI